MNPKVKNLFLLLSMLAFIGISSCEKSKETEKTESKSELQLRIVNDTGPISTPGAAPNLIDGPITVTIISDESASDFDGYKATVDFGKLNKGQTSEYKRVSNRFLVKVNNETFGDSRFGIATPPHNKWTLKIISKQNTGYSFTYGWDLSIN